MKKEYSDLNDRQKIVYMKRFIIWLGFMIIPFVVSIGMLILLFPFDYYLNNVVDVNDTLQSLWILLNVVILCCVSIGFFYIFSEIAYWIVNYFEFYTELNLENAENDLKKIKNIIKEYSMENKD